MDIPIMLCRIRHTVNGINGAMARVPASRSPVAETSFSEIDITSGYRSSCLDDRVDGQQHLIGSSFG
jgi:hypothetical protein